jgi:membrane-associated phospholipid phosphatase
MSVFVAAGRRALPRGYGDFFWQLAIWFGFYVAYQAVRSRADHDVGLAFENARRVADLEQRLGSLWELSLQGAIQSSELVIRLTSWTYWLSQFAVLGLALLWTYLRHNGRFLRFRNTILVANLIGLVGYALMPTAPPRMLPELGFVDTLALFSDVNHSSSAVQAASNPYAAMPSLHAADALIVGIFMAMIVRRPLFKLLWLAWPVWVWFTVMATANHWWLDIAAGIVVAGAAAGLLELTRRRRRARPAPAAA